MFSRSLSQLCICLLIWFQWGNFFTSLTSWRLGGGKDYGTVEHFVGKTTFAIITTSTKHKATNYLTKKTAFKQMPDICQSGECVTHVAVPKNYKNRIEHDETIRPPSDRVCKINNCISWMLTVLCTNANRMNCDLRNSKRLFKQR